MLVGMLVGRARAYGRLKQGYDGGWGISSDPEPLDTNGRLGLPNGTFPTCEALVEAIHAATAKPASRDGAGLEVR